MNHPAQSRLNADIQRLLATMIIRDVSDPRLHGVSITRVESAGVHVLNVWVHAIQEVDPEVCVRQLMRMKPHFEHALRRAMPRRRIPALRFQWDHAADRAHSVQERLRLIREK